MTKKQITSDLKLLIYFLVNPARLVRLLHGAQVAEAVLSGPQISAKTLGETRDMLRNGLGVATHPDREIFWLMSYRYGVDIHRNAPRIGTS